MLLFCTPAQRVLQGARGRCRGRRACVQALLRHEEEVEANSGVWWQAALALVPLDADAARAKGIKRGVDKARLPVPAGPFLTPARPVSNVRHC